jgi:hypothetical protein
MAKISKDRKQSNKSAMGPCKFHVSSRDEMAWQGKAASCLLRLRAAKGVLVWLQNFRFA